MQDFKAYKAVQDSISAQYPGYNSDGYVSCQENGEPYEPRTYQDLFKRCVRRAGIADANFHSLRHTFATRSLEQGMDVVTVSRLLGHANPSITLDKYGHALDDHKRNRFFLCCGIKIPHNIIILSSQHTLQHNWMKIFVYKSMPCFCPRI